MSGNNKFDINCADKLPEKFKQEVYRLYEEKANREKAKLESEERKKRREKREENPDFVSIAEESLLFLPIDAKNAEQKRLLM